MHQLFEIYAQAGVILGACANRLFAVTAIAAGAQDKQRTNDAIATTVGVVVFWPALFFIGGDKQTAAELARLKDEMDAIEQTSIRKNCGIQFQRAPAAASYAAE